ncbi:hypothetical protein [Aquabacterium sp.]|uniref:glycosyltransferase family protein n=1 Tax=Aquabacterium sp. TaxID=1872578 RepID=UPI00262836E4|nr:hypothetical protein [Aquabacterium sp.]MDD2976678.1 hypothetical protein [Aquabacterium sp.]
MSQNDVFLVIAFDHPLQAVESVADRIATALCCQGVNAAACSLPRDLQKLASIPPDKVTGILSMGSVPLSHRLGDGWLWEHFACPVTVYLLDAILYDLARVPVLRHFLAAARQDPRLSLASPESGYAQWLQESVGVRWDHLPFGHFAKIKPGEPAVVPQARLCVIGTIGQELGNNPANENLPGLLERVGLSDPLLRTRVQDALLASDADAMPARTVSEQLGWNPETALQHLPALIAVDSWVKRHRRLAAVRSLQGVPVDFFGTGWRELLGDVPDFRYVGNIKHQDIATLLRHYRGLVNFDPNWQHGVHDRVYTACAMGTAVITNDNTALGEDHLPAELISTYSAQNPELTEQVRDIGILGQQPSATTPRYDVMQSHCWTNRIAKWMHDYPIASNETNHQNP